MLLGMGKRQEHDQEATRTRRFAFTNPSLEDDSMLLGMGKRQEHDQEAMRTRRFAFTNPSLEDDSMLLGMGKRQEQESMRSKRFSSDPSLEDVSMLLGMGKKSYPHFNHNVEDAGDFSFFFCKTSLYYHTKNDTTQYNVLRPKEDKKTC